jgi:pimeloyl-ACP methyl ester carboxylesterase
MVPEIRYAKSGNVHIAYQITGDGPVDLVFVHGWISHIEHLWEEPSLARFLSRLASFSRLILLDKRGTGLSDPVPLDKLPTLEERMDDLRAVMDAAGSERAALLGTSEAGALNLLFSATHPDRTAALILLNSYARLTSGPGSSPHLGAAGAGLHLMRPQHFQAP